MDPVRETIDGIISVSQRLINGLATRPARESRVMTVEISRVQLSGDLHKIVAASLAIMETLTESLDYGRGSLDERLTDWLASHEPVACKDVLGTMARLVDVDDKGVWRWLPKLPLAPTGSKDKVKEAIVLFSEHREHFHFLLTTDVWNWHERDSRLHLGIDSDELEYTPDEIIPFVGIDGRGPTEIPTTVDAVMYDVTERSGEKEEVDRKLLEEILEWIDGLNCAEKQEDTIELRQPGTCTWLVETSTYKSWRSDQESFLWLHGKPGAGKTVLTASVIDGLESSMEDGEVLAFFYCDFRNERSTNAAEAMRSILSQLLQAFFSDASDPGDSLGELSKEKGRGGSILKSAKRLARFISAVAAQLTRSPLIVIDALDECKDIENLLDALDALSQARLRLFATSRPLHQVKDKFRSLPSLSLEKMIAAVSADISLHVTRELDSNRRLRMAPLKLKEEIHTKLCQNADGMFRWIQCQLETLKRCVTPMDIRKALENLPRGLEETYKQILLTIDKEEHEAKVARRTLTWLVATFSPLRLSQIIEALSIDLTLRILNPDIAPIHGSTLLDVLSSLVTHDEDTDVVILAHFSVQEYLTGELAQSQLPTYYIDLQYAEGLLLQFCMCYIAAYLKQVQGIRKGSHSTDASWIDPSSSELSPSVERRVVASPSPDSQPLLEYVLYHTFDHLGLVDPGNKVVLSSLSDLEEDVRRNPLGWERIRPEKKSPAWPSSEDDFIYYMLVVFGTEPLLRSFLGRGRVNSKPGTNPLIYAAQYDRVEHAKTLVSRGAPLNRSGLLVSSHSRQVSPLEAAVIHRSSAVVDLLLKEGTPVPEKIFLDVLKPGYLDFVGGARVAEKLLRTDEFAEWVVEALPNDSPVPHLLGSLDYTHVHVVEPELWPNDEDIVAILRRLVQVGCHPIAHRSFLQKLFHQVTAAGHTSSAKYMLSVGIPPPPDLLLCVPCTRFFPSSPVMRILVKGGVDPHAVTDNGNSALHLAIGSEAKNFVISEGDCLERIKLLVDIGCDMSLCNLAGETPLWLAARRGFISVVQYMLSRGASRPPNLLHSISRIQSKKVPMLRYLLSTCNKSDVFVATDDGNTMLHVALDCSSDDHQGAEEDCLESVKILVNAGCNPCLVNLMGETAMDVALRTTHVSVVTYFLMLGIPLPPDALLKVSMVRSFSPEWSQMIKMLIGQRVDVSIVSPDGNGALHWTVACYLRADMDGTVKSLVEAGCNVFAYNSSGQTPMHLAASYDHRSTVAYFLSRGVPLPRDIMLVATTGELYAYLIERGANLDVKATNGDTPLHIVIDKVFPERDALKLTRTLVGARCNPRARNSAGEDPIQIAVRRGYTSVVEYLLSLNVSSLPSDILLVASFRPRLYRHPGSHIIRFLVERGFTTNVFTDSGHDSPLHLVLSSNFPEGDVLKTAKILIDAGCEPRAPNSTGETALHSATKRGHLVVIEYLLSRGVPLYPDILFTSAKADFQRKPKVMRFLIDKGADPRAVTSNGDTALHLTLAHSYEPVRLQSAQVLIDSGCYLSRPNLAGKMPIHVAASSGYPPLVKLLLSRNVALPFDILLSGISAVGITSTHFQRPRVLEMINLLLHKGADVSVRAPNGDNLLHIAFRLAYAHKRTIPWFTIGVLLRAGCNPWVCNADGQTPLDIIEVPVHAENFVRLVDAYCGSDWHRNRPNYGLGLSSSKRRVEDVQVMEQPGKRGRFDSIGDEDEMAEVDEELMV